MGNKLPKGWENKNLVECIPIVKTGVREYKGGKPYYSTGAVVNDSISPEGHYSFKKRPSRANRLVIKGDVVQARMQGTTKALLIDENLDGSLFSTGFLQFRPFKYTYDSRLFYHYLCSDLFLKQRDEFASGSTQIALTDKGASRINLVVPPAEQQKRIADKLDILLAKVKDNQLRLSKILLILKHFRQSILIFAFSGSLTKDWRDENKIYKNWIQVELKEKCKRLQYGTSKKSHKSGDVPVLRMGNLQSGEIDWNNLVYTSDKSEIKKFTLDKNTVLFNRTNSPELVGKTSIFRGDRPVIFAGYLIRIETNDDLDPEYLNYYLNSCYADEWKYHVKTDGVSQSNINAKKLGGLKIPFPSIEEQKEIVLLVKRLFDLADSIEERCLNTKKYIDNIGRSILAKAFRGELVKQGPKDEPTDKFLAKTAKKK